jgi:hypothetical protein
VDDKTRRLLKQWYRKYPLAKDQALNPFEDFVPELSPYQMLRERLGELLDIIGIKIRSKNNPTGNISVTHYMSLLQKLTSALYPVILKTLYSIPDGYDYKEDPRGYKTRRAQKNTAILFQQVAAGKTDNFLTDWLNNAARYIVNTMIPMVIDVIDDGKNVLTHKLGQTKEGNTQVLITDTSLGITKAKTLKKDQKAISDIVMSRFKK